MKKTLTLLFLISLSSVFGQEGFVLSGGDATGSGGSVSYSYGLVFYETVNGTNGELTQGVQQSIEIYSLSTPSNSVAINLAMYPNPAISQVTLDLNFTQFQDVMKYELFNVNGKLLKTGTIVSNQTNIDLDILPKATYVLNVITSNKLLKSFKLIKK
ncbi:T9SS type A sorting domain-containing protein [Flavobacterium sp.]|uniref:T9SS type A sorting domain-containing protein n=1 Tax=Flavobacterium sp. TaxID=239 RepID=UPI00404718D8